MIAPKVFVSWASGDSAPASRVRDALESSGFKVYFSADHNDNSIAVGDDIEEELAIRIEESDAFVALLSDESLGKRWVQKELGFANTWRHNRDMPVLAFQVGPLDLENLPDMFDGALIAGVDGRPDAAYVELIRGLRKHLGLPAPEVVKIALITMNREELTELNNRRPELFNGLNTASLEQNYPCGGTAEVFRPFRSWQGPDAGRPLVRLIEEAISKINDRRISSGQPPLVGEFHGRAELVTLNQEERAIWRESATMVFIDALSMNCDSVREVLQRVPQSRRPEQALVAWLPLPQSAEQIRDALEATRTALTDVPPYQDYFHDYVTFIRPHDPLHFEIGSEPAAQHSVHAFCESLHAATQIPQAERRASVRSGNRRRRYVGTGAPGIKG